MTKCGCSCNHKPQPENQNRPSMGFNFWKDETKGSLLDPDPITQDWWLSSRWTPVIALTVYILATVIIGPSLMKTREPLALKPLVNIYNLVILAVNLCLTMGLLYYQVLARYNPFCQPVKSGNEDLDFQIASMYHLYFMAKLLELSDTLVIVVRKRTGVHTAIHYYHHSTIVIFAWLGMRYLPGGITTVLATINCVSHTAIYFYFNVISWHWKCFPIALYRSISIYTNIGQFIASLLICTTSFIMGCGYPRPALTIMFFYIGIFLIIFSLPDEFLTNLFRSSTPPNDTERSVIGQNSRRRSGVLIPFDQQSVMTSTNTNKSTASAAT